MRNHWSDLGKLDEKAMVQELQRFQISLPHLTFESISWLSDSILKYFPKTTWKEFMHSLLDIHAFFPGALPEDIGVMAGILAEQNAGHNGFRNAVRDMVVIQGATNQNLALKDLSMQLALLQGSLKVTHSAGGQHQWQETTEAISLLGRAFPNFQVQDFTDLVNDWSARFGKGGALTVEAIAEALANLKDLAGDAPLKQVEEDIREFHNRWGQPINLHIFTMGVASLYHSFGGQTNRQ